MRRWVSFASTLALACSVVVVVAPASVGAAQNCTGPGDGDVGSLSLVDSGTGDFDGDGPNNDTVEVFYDVGSTAAMTRITLDNGYQQVFDHGSVTFNIFLDGIRDVDQDGVEAGGRRHLRDAVAHRSGPDDAPPADLRFFVQDSLPPPAGEPIELAIPTGTAARRISGGRSWAARSGPRRQRLSASRLSPSNGRSLAREAARDSPAGSARTSPSSRSASAAAAPARPSPR